MNRDATCVEKGIRQGTGSVETTSNRSTNWGWGVKAERNDIMISIIECNLDRNGTATSSYIKMQKIYKYVELWGLPNSFEN